MRFQGPARWPVEIQLLVFMLNAMCLGATASESRHGVDWLSIAMFPLNATWVVWVGVAMAQSRRISSEDA